MKRILADECVHLAVAEALQAAGFNVLLVKDVYPGCNDDEVLFLASEQKRILLTRDKDFGELTIRFRKKVPGIIRYSLSGMPIDRQAEYIIKALKKAPAPLTGHITTVESERVRQRPIR